MYVRENRKNDKLSCAPSFCCPAATTLDLAPSGASDIHIDMDSVKRYRKYPHNWKLFEVAVLF